VVSYSSPDPFDLKIEEGKNVNLNIFMKEELDEIGKVERKDSKDKGRIDIIIYPLALIEAGTSTQVVKGAQRIGLLQEEVIEKYEGLTITHEPIKVVSDDTVLENNADADYWWSYGPLQADYKCIGASSERKGKCLVTSLKSEYKDQILMHSYDWWLKRHGVPDNEINKCIYDNCLLAHEKKHMELAIDIVKREWDNFKKIVENEINNNKDCCNDTECSKAIEEIFNKMREEVRKKIEDTEEQANRASEECKKNCREVKK
jgi:gas vesicle protein